MVTLDVGCAFAPTGLDHIRVQGALDQELDLFAFQSSLSHDGSFCLFEGADKFAANDLALSFRIGDPGQGVQEPVLLVGNIQLSASGGHEVELDLLGLALTE